jgi:hypothetical protein
VLPLSPSAGRLDEIQITVSKPKIFSSFIIVAAFLLAGEQWGCARPVPGLWPPVPMRPPTHLPPWHGLVHHPGTNLPAIHFYDKLNPVWWAENANEPTPPPWYQPGDPHRDLKWHFRNPFHNFDFYVMGVADKKFTRYGRYPGRNGSPLGGWNLEIVHRRLAFLPFISYERPRITFYLGWRESGAFGIELRLHHRPRATP